MLVHPGAAEAVLAHSAGAPEGGDANVWRLIIPSWSGRVIVPRRWLNATSCCRLRRRRCRCRHERVGYLLQMGSDIAHRPFGCNANVVARRLQLTSRVVGPFLQLLAEFLSCLARCIEKLLAAARKLFVGGPDAFLDAVADGIARFRDGRLGAIQH